MSRHARQDYHAYNQQAHLRWSPSPPINRISNPADPRIVSRVATSQQDIQPQPLPISQINHNPTSAPISSNAEIVQAIHAMNAQMTGQLSMIGTQLASLVSLTSRLIEISQLASVNGNSDASRVRSQNTTGVSRAPSPHTTNILPNTSPNNNRARPINGASLAETANLIDNSSAHLARPETRSGPFYSITSSNSNNNYRTLAQPHSESTLDRTFGSTLRGASPPPSSPSVNPLASGAVTNANIHTRSQPMDATDSHKSRLPSPVFVDDPIDMATDPVSEASQPSDHLAKRQPSDPLAVSQSDLTTTTINHSNAGNDSMSKKPLEIILGDWKPWVEHNWSPSALDENVSVKYRTMQSARKSHKEMTKRSMATLGRLPLKEFLEIKPEQYLNVRKAGRKVYQEWLYPEVRLAKQPEDRMKAAINRIEHEHPTLGDCDNHWKAKQLLQQIIDNAIDEANLHRKKTQTANPMMNVESQESTPRGNNTDSSRNRANNLRTDSTKKGAANSATKSARSGNRRKADQAELEDTPSRFRAPPAPVHSETILSSSRQIDEQSLHAHNSLSSSLDGASHSRSTIADYSNYGNPDGTAMAAATSDQTRNGGATTNDQGWPPAQPSTSSLFSQSSYHHHQPPQQQPPPPPLPQQQQQQPQQQPPPPNQQATLSHQAYGNHHSNPHAPHYLSSESHHHHHPSSGTGLGSSSSLLDAGSHDGHRAHSHSHLSPLVNGGVRMTANTASAPGPFSFDYRHHPG